MVYTYYEHSPEVDKAAFIAPNATVIGQVILGENASVWFNATLRGDINSITVGDNTNIQDGCVVHVDEDQPTTIGNSVTIGHNAVIHGCTIGNNTLIGMGATILNGAQIGDECIVGAGALVTEGKKYPPRSLIVGSPAKNIYTLSDQQLELLKKSAAEYVKNARNMKEQTTPDRESH